MKLLLTKGYGHKPEGLKLLFEGKEIHVHGDSDIRTVTLKDDRKLLIAGNVIGFRGTDDSIRKVSENDYSALFLAGVSGETVRNLEGRFLMMLCSTSDASVHVFADNYGQFDCYYAFAGEKAAFACDLSLLPESPSSNGYDQVGLAHGLTVYGYRPAKKHTIYKNVRRLGVGEIAFVKPEKFEIKHSEFKPVTIVDYKEADHEHYADLFLDALRIRGSEQGNVVYLSSGWDSTSILGGLVHLFGANKVKAVIGRMRYSERAGTINPFEIERAKKVAEYYSVHLEIVEFDYTREVPKVLDHLKETMKSNFVASATIFSHGILAEHIASNFKNGESVFAGEISDGAHNLGFSQYVTIFHPVLEFREYSDKMASYLYGPTFMKAFLNGTYRKDIIYNLLRNQAEETVFDTQSKGSDIEKSKQLLASFFLRNQRLPLVSLDNMKLLTQEGGRYYSDVMESTYLEKVAQSISPDTVYSWYLYLYSSFHWQSATVATLPLTAQAYGFDIQLPFYDSHLQHFLAAMPENWGRGLDLKPTKYPLKIMLEKRIDYPLHLQVGPHSYLYDVDHTFNHSVEIANHSAFTPLFKELLSRYPYREILSPQVFDLNYIDAITDRYVSGEEITGADLNTLFPLCFLSLIGWY